MLGCSTPSSVPQAPSFTRSQDSAQALQSLADAGNKLDQQTIIRPGPRPAEMISGNLRPITPAVQPSEEGGNLTVTLEQMPLGAFIQAVYGGILQLNYTIDASVNARPDLVTFRTPKPISAARLTEVTSQLLKSYGVAVQDYGGLISITPSTSIASTLPLIRRGRAQPTVPLPLRPIFHYVETEAVQPNTFINTLKSMLGDKVKVEITQLGGLLLSGQPDDVQVALELVQVFDQPTLRSQNNMRVVPRFWGAEEFARRLAEVLRAEGYAVGLQAGGSDPISLVALPPINSVLIFATSQNTLNHVIEWVKELDQLTAVQAGSSFFTYPVRNTDAQELAKSLNELISSSTSTASASQGSSSSTSPVQTTRRRGVVVNNATNSLIFQGGSQEDYRQWLALLAELDKPVRSAMLDVLVAEVSLRDENDLGFSWKLDQLGSGASAVRLSGTTYDLSASGSGLKINALLGGNPLRQLAINALATSSDSRVISNPKIITRNGESANINVGQEVPTVTSQAVTGGNGTIIGGNTTVVPQTVQYRNTGVLLRVRPVIHSGDRIDIEVSQEVSSAESTLTGVTSSPTIRKRSVETKLSLRDGATVMLGGLISETNTVSDSGIPLLKDIPYVGNLFKSNKKSRDRTELVMLITPYILNDSVDAEAATDAYQTTLGEWAQSIRERVQADRLKRLGSPSTAIEQQKISKEATNPLPPLSAQQVMIAPPATQKEALGSSEVKEQQPSQKTAPLSQERMLNLSTRKPEPVGTQIKPASPSNAFPATQSNSSNSATPRSQQAATTTGTSAAASTAKPAPSNIGGANTPQGATVVEDKELLNDIMKSFNR